MEKSRYIVSADWVEKQLGAPEFRIVDASWYLPVQKRNGAEEYASGHIPGAVFFDQDRIADLSNPLSHTLPSAELFATEVAKLGISDTDTIVVYDGPGLQSAARVWWMLTLMGAKNVFVLDGGMDGWKREKRPIETDLPEPRPGIFHARFDQSKVISFDAMMSVVKTGSSEIVDARSAGRFYGEEAEPRAGMRSGHMPGAKNVPFSSLVQNGSLKPLSRLRDVLKAAGLDLSKPVVTSCGSGITAAVITLALASLGHSDNRLYDGSWAEWGGRDDTPITTDKD